MLSNIFTALKSIVDFIQMEWSHVVSFFGILGQSLTAIPKFLTYIPLFAVPFVSVGISVLFVRKIINR